jgi:hypothetical protein
MGQTLGLPFADSPHPIASHHSALAAEDSAKRRGAKTMIYLRLLAEAGASGLSDHAAARMMGVPLSTVNSIRNGCGALVVPAVRREPSPHRANLHRIDEQQQALPETETADPGKDTDPCKA